MIIFSIEEKTGCCLVLWVILWASLRSKSSIGYPQLRHLDGLWASLRSKSSTNEQERRQEAATAVRDKVLAARRVVAVDRVARAPDKDSASAQVLIAAVLARSASLQAVDV
jgi:hypothetical protein